MGYGAVGVELFIGLLDTPAAFTGHAGKGTRVNTGADALEFYPLEAELVFIIDGGSVAITTGEKGHLVVPFDCEIQSNELEADQSGSIVIDIWKDTYANFPPVDADSITAAAPPTIAAAQKAKDETLTGWTTSLTKADVLAFNVDSVTDIQRVTVTLHVIKS